MTDDEEYDVFLGIMFNTWSADEMAYVHNKVQHPSYGSTVKCAYCNYPQGDPGCTFCGNA